MKKFQESFYSWIKNLFPEPKHIDQGANGALCDEPTTNADRRLGIFCGLLAVASGIVTLGLVWQFSLSFYWLAAVLLTGSFSFGTGFITKKGFREIPVGWKGQLLFLGGRIYCFFAEGWHWVLWPIFDIKMVDCRQEIRKLNPLKVFSSDGVQLDISGSIIFRKKYLHHFFGVKENDINDGINEMWDETLRTITIVKTENEILGMRLEIGKQIQTTIEAHASHNWGLEIIRVVISGIEPSEELRKDKELRRRELYQQDGQKIELTLVAEEVKKLMAAGFSREQAIEQVQLSLGKITSKTIDQKNIAFDNVTAEALGSALARFLGGR